MNDLEAKEANGEVRTKDLTRLHENSPKEEARANAWLWESYSPDTLAALMDP